MSEGSAAQGVPVASWSMNSYDAQPWRPGRKVGRTVYAQQGQMASDEDVLPGVETEALRKELIQVAAMAGAWADVCT